MDSSVYRRLCRANLNTTYFTNRQDRYLRFTDQPHLANYCFEFLKAASTFSYSLLPSASPTEEYTLQWPDATTHPHRIEAKARQVLLSLQKMQRDSSTARPIKSVEDNLQSDSHGHDVLVFPVIQAGQFDIREEERCVTLLLRELSGQQRYTILPKEVSAYNGPLVDLTSGYFSLHKPYQKAVINAGLACRILAASPKVRGALSSSAEMTN